MLGYIYKGVISSMYVYIHFFYPDCKAVWVVEPCVNYYLLNIVSKATPESASFASIQKPLSQDENAMAQQSHILAELVHSTWFYKWSGNETPGCFAHSTNSACSTKYNPHDLQAVLMQHLNTNQPCPGPYNTATMSCDKCVSAWGCFQWNFWKDIIHYLLS